MTRKPLIAANWKQNGSTELVEIFSKGLKTEQLNGVDVLLCVPSLFLISAMEKAKGFSIGAQNVSAYPNGAFTGELSASMLSDVGLKFVIIGHSERRSIFGESDSTIAEKVKLALKNDLTPVLCVGETEEQRENGVTESVIKEQLQAVIDKCGIEAFGSLVVAYEPVWAIGTGKTATPEQAQDVHKAIRAFIASSDMGLAEKLRILYGGSVKASNAQTLLSMPDIDGGLIGGASLKLEEFSAICQHAAGLS